MKKFLSIFFLLLVNAVAFAQSIFNPDDVLKNKPNGLVNDYTHTLTADQTSTLEYKLDTFDKRTSTQIAVVVVPGLGDYDVSDYAVKLGRAWGVGGKQFNNGIVLIICNDPN